MAKVLLKLFLLLCFTSCATDPLQSTATDQVVVEGYLYLNQPIDQIRLSHPLSILDRNNRNTPLSDAEVYISRASQSIKLAEFNEEPGRYFCSNIDFLPTVGDTFYLRIFYKDQEITSQTIIPPAPVIQQVSGDTLSTGLTKSNTTSIIINWNIQGNLAADLFFVNVFNVEPFPAPLPKFSFLTTPPLPIWSPPFPGHLYQLDGAGLTHSGNHQATVNAINREYANLFISQTQGNQDFMPLMGNIENGLGIFTAISPSQPVNFFVK